LREFFPELSGLFPSVPISVEVMSSQSAVF
jgi:hypothetical protein